jgi:1,4-alpha-glucan branching enzyme
MRHRTSIDFVAAALLALALACGCVSLAPRSRVVGPTVEADGIRFRFFAPTAHRVQLAGSWSENNWAQGDGPVGEADIGLMVDDDSDGVWEIVVPLGAGRYQYLFWIDEATWSLDPGNPEEVDGGPQGRSSEVVVVVRNGRLEVR